MKGGRVLVPVLLAATTVAGLGVTPAAAATSGTSSSSAVKAKAGSLAVTPAGSGLLGSSLVTAIQPLADALNGLASTAASSLASALSRYTAVNAGGAQSAPASGYPTCGSSGWTASNCYTGASTTAAASPLVSLGIGAIQGYAAGDTTSYKSASSVANAALTVLGIGLGNLGTVTSSSSCTATTCATGTATLIGTSLFGGAVGLSLSSGNLLQVTVGGATTSVAAASGKTVSFNGSTVTLSASGAQLRMSLVISLADLLNGLGLGGLLAGLAAYALDTTGTTLALTMIAGPGSTTAATSSVTSYGLDLGLDLSGVVNLAVSGALSGLLGSVSLTIPAGAAGSPNLLDLDLAYTNAASGQPPPSGPVWIPPGLI